MKQYTATIINGEIDSIELKEDLKRAEGVSVDITIERSGNKKRSVEQNARLWALYDKILKYYETNQKDFVVDLMTSVRAEITAEFIHEMMKQWWIGGKSTTKLSTEQMNKYMEALEEHFFHKYGVHLNESD